jgi:hypothetical protein
MKVKRKWNFLNTSQEWMNDPCRSHSHTVFAVYSMIVIYVVSCCVQVPKCKLKSQSGAFIIRNFVIELFFFVAPVLFSIGNITSSKLESRHLKSFVVSLNRRAYNGRWLFLLRGYCILISCHPISNLNVDATRHNQQRKMYIIWETVMQL